MNSNDIFLGWNTDKKKKEKCFFKYKERKVFFAAFLLNRGTPDAAALFL